MPLINFSGLASGIDSNALISATSEATRATRVKPQQEKVTELEETNTSFDELKTKLTSIKTQLGNFTSLNGGGVSKTATSSRESVLTASAANGAVTGSYSVTVNALAKNAVLSFNTTYPSASGAIQSSLTGGESTADRTITVNIGTGSNLETVNVVVTNSTYSISDFVTAFNNASSKAEAALVNVGTATTPAYKVVITSNNEGTEKGQILLSFSGSTAITNWNTAVTDYIVDQASNASLDIAGIGTITRSTNTINDVLTGVTLSLVSASATASTIKITEDAATTKSKIQEFVDGYNELVTYIKERDTITRDETGSDVKSIFGPLAGTSIDENLLTTIRDQIASTLFTGGTNVRILAELGITTQRDGTIEFRTADFDSVISSEPSSVGSVLQKFADTLASTGGTIDQFIRFNGTIDLAVNGNKTRIGDLNDRIAEAERQILKTEENMRGRFARLESLIGRLQNQQSALTSALSGLGR